MKKLLSLVLGLALWAAPAGAVVQTTLIGNAAYTILASDQRVVTTIAFTTSRTWTLPGAAATAIGQGTVNTLTNYATVLEIVDAVGAITATNTLVIAPASGDTINGSSTSLTFTTPNVRVQLVPLSGNNWIATSWIDGAGINTGTNTNDNACAGCVGEVIQSTATSAPLLSTTVPATVQSTTITAGDWDCRGSVNYVSSGGATTVFTVWTSSTAPPAIPNVSAVNNNQPSVQSIQTASIISPAWALTAGTMRYSVAAATSVFLAAAATFSTGTPSASGILQCRRAR